MKKITHALILVALVILLSIVMLYLAVPLSITPTSQVAERQLQITNHRTALIRVWESRQDLQFYFPDKENGIDKMEGWTLTQWAEEIGWKEYKVLKQYNEEAEKEYIYNKYKDIERALNKIASRKYVVNEYDCKHFSIDLQNELANAGISSVTITGFSEISGHRWVAIEVEPTSGRIIYANEHLHKYPKQMLTTNKTRYMSEQ